MTFGVCSAVVCGRNKLAVYSSDGLVVHWEYPLDMFVNGEVVDSQKLTAGFDNFWKGYKYAKKKTVVVLGVDMIFQKNFVVDISKGQMNEQINQFWEEIPLNLKDIGKKTVQTQSGITAIAANKSFYWIIRRVIAQYTSDPKVIVVTFFPELYNKAVWTAGDVKGLFAQRKNIELAAMDENVIVSDLPSSGVGRVTKIIWLVAVIILVVVGGLALFIYLRG